MLKSSLLLVMLLVGLASGFAGWLLGGERSVEPAERASLPAPAVTREPYGALAEAIAVLSQRVEELGREVRALRSSPQPAGAGGEAPRESLAGTSADSASLEATLQRLAAALERLQGSTPAIPLRPPLRRDPQPFPMPRERAEKEELRRELLLEGYQSVLDRWGVPTTIRPSSDGGVTWVYHDEQENRSLIVQFVGGLVYHVN